MSSQPSTPDSRYVDEQGRTDAETYLLGALDGTIVAGEKMRMLADKMLPRISDGYKQWRYDPSYAIRPVKFMEDFCVVPTGKLGNPLVLEPYERMIVELAFGFVDDDNLRQIQYELIEMGRKNGKCLGIDTEVATPSGWKRIADVHTGDYVFGQDGKPSMVIAESDVFYDKPVYLVTFEDGSKVKATDDHVWTVVGRDEPLCFATVYGSARDMTTGEMLEGFELGRYHVPLCRPVEYGLARLPSHPYDVGASLVGRAGAELPDEYLTASVGQRRAVVSGIEDACRAAGIHIPVLWTRELADRVAELYASLGVLTFTYEHLGRFYVSVDRARWTKSITSIERIPNEPTKCIAIDNQSHLYLAGRGYTATHNTTLAAAIELYLLLADREGAPQIYSAATSKAQASGVYGAALRMVRRSPKLAKHVYKGTVVERQEDGIICTDNLGYITKLSHESSHLDGLDVHGSIYDELAAERDRSAFDLIRQGTGAREQPLMVVISTQGFVRDNIWDVERDYGMRWLEGRIEDDRFLGVFFEMDDRSEIFDESMWPKANPGLGTVKKWQYLRDQITKARNDPQYLPTVLVKDFNIVANQATSYLTYEEASCNETFEFDPRRFRYCVVGFDTSEVGDLFAAVAMFMEPGSDVIYEEAMYWIAEEQVKINSNSFRQRDGVPYHQWAADGYLQIVEGDKVDQIVVIDWMRSLADRGLYTYAVGYDKWHVDDFTKRQLEMMVGKGRSEAVIQGAQTLSAPMKEIKVDMRANRIVDNGNPVTRWCRTNVMAKYDNNENVVPVKKGLSARNRIDGFLAELDAYITLKRHWDGYQASL